MCQRRGAHSLAQPGVFDPAAHGAAVEAADHWNIDRRDGSGDVFDVGVWPNMVVRVIGNIRQRLHMGARATFTEVMQRTARMPALFLEQRVQHDRAGASISQAASTSDACRERRRRHDQRCIELKPEIGRPQIHHWSPPCIRPCGEHRTTAGPRW
jgi:hypothetical protein